MAVRRPGLCDELQWTFVEADYGTLRVVWLGGQLEYILHVGYEGWANLRDAPVLLEPRLEPFFKASRRTVSSEMDGTSWRTTNSFASSCIVQQVRPSGGFAHASAISVARARWLSMGPLPGRGLSHRATSSPLSTNRFRVRSTIEGSCRSQRRSGHPSTHRWPRGAPARAPPCVREHGLAWSPTRAPSAPPP